jgi:hypothetical protein
LAAVKPGRATIELYGRIVYQLIVTASAGGTGEATVSGWMMRARISNPFTNRGPGRLK